ncbi:ankyrin 2,3/unc44 [Culex quinquefasciatus]|uniref:Ankyrin 2,3/unc44 n=1 Tax=Culex quinquefasciatus TaxID=7176 RepID=B0XBJ4_CULQU|nr:ankyrin 2,3/unc44 [Culex quinquefasciatus]|eukprot:XP_001867016.1 ankyrin 2,3/unc44 [Culex quinquefasciatus]
MLLDLGANANLESHGDFANRHFCGSQIQLRAVGGFGVCTPWPTFLGTPQLHAGENLQSQFM